MWTRFSTASKPELVSAAVRQAPFESASGQPNRIALAVVIAAVLHINPASRFNRGSPAEFSSHMRIRPILAKR
jgi:hypothetical protein